ncbi:hypothetical protein ACLQ3C_02335 [Gordonia sp. DT30]|uniref:hypothetical protein n=1 Tax=unclassified Gordonia (in: high G+C Gram-positive bacteria) TaxID=2657482 RepID=UPI003CF64DA7
MTPFSKFFGDLADRADLPALADRLFGTDDDTLFGIDADELAEIEATWRDRARAVADITVDQLADLSGPPSRTVGALRSLADPAHAATDSISELLLAMSVALGHFAADALDTDAAAGRALDLLPER